LKRLFTWPRAFLGAILLFAVAALAVPNFTEGWCRDRLLRALEQGSGRKVKIGQVSFRLVPTPGFAIDHVRIGEDPAIGAEPVAWVDTLVVRPSLLSLLEGEFAIASVRLEDNISLNLTRVDNAAHGVTWNFASLVSEASGTKATAFPAIHMSGARINFKFGDTKSIFYLTNTDVDLAPASIPGGPLKIRIGGEPARTDRRADTRGFGSFVANGQWNPADHSLELDVKLEKSELNDVLTLFDGRESALLGRIWGDAHLAGPMSKIGISGRLNVSDLHGWNQSPPGGNASLFNIGGTINAPGQVIELQASGAGKQSPIGASFRVADYLRRPRWTATVSLDGVPVAPVTGIARNFGIALPADLTLDGVAQGTIGYSTGNDAPIGAATDVSGMQGQVRVSNATLAAQGAPPLKIAQADLKFAGSTIALSPTSIVNDAGESADIDGLYDTASGELQVSLTSTGMAIASLRRQVSVAGAPLLGLATAGVWSGSLRYASAAAPDLASGAAQAGWTGDIHLKDTDIPFEAFAQPIHLVEADAGIDNEGAVLKRMSLTVAGIAATGEYRYETGATHPHRFRIALESASAVDLEAVLTPTLRRASILTYAFNFGRVPEPDWLRNMHAEGTIQAPSLVMAGMQIANVRTDLIWDGTDVSLTGLTGRVADAAFTGWSVIHLAGRQPRYEVNGNLSGFAWQGGTLTAAGTLTTSGLGTDLLSNMRLEGAFSGRKLEVPTLNPWDSVEGRFDFAFENATPRLRLSALTIQSAGTKWTGGAETQEGGQMVLKVADGARHMEASGALLRGEALKPVP
jgi:uncharacterized protein involved in outer membrane biogenesis